MDNFHAAYEQFQRDYHEFELSKHDTNKKYHSCSQIIRFKNFNLRLYVSSGQPLTDIFFIVPSIFNSAEIFFINRKENFIDHLSKHGQIIIIEWLKRQAPSSNFNDYIKDTCFALQVIQTKFNKNVNLIGQCLGGNIAIAAASMQPHSIQSLTLLTTPWDFSYYLHMIKLYKGLNLDRPVKLLTHLPKIYLQILFFLLSPNNFFTKIRNYNTLTNDIDKEFYLAVENWLESGLDIPHKVFQEIINSFIQQNSMLNLKFKFRDKIINPKDLTIPICQVIAKKDWLTPPLMMDSLSAILQKPYIIEVDGGHISYLITSKLKNFFMQYLDWLRRI